MAAHAHLKNEFTEDEKCHNLMTWLKAYQVMRSHYLIITLSPRKVDHQTTCLGIVWWWTVEVCILTIKVNDVYPHICLYNQTSAVYILLLVL